MKIDYFSQKQTRTDLNRELKWSWQLRSLSHINALSVFIVDFVDQVQFFFYSDPNKFSMNQSITKTQKDKDMG